MTVSRGHIRSLLLQETASTCARAKLPVLPRTAEFEGWDIADRIVSIEKGLPICSPNLLWEEKHYLMFYSTTIFCPF